MRLTKAGEYAVRCVLYLCAQEQGIIVSRMEIARKMEIPDQFLGKIAQQLSRAGVLDILQGAKGGFRLSILPEQVNLLLVIEAVMGEIFLNDCLIRPDFCRRSYTCGVHSVWKKARNQLRDTLREASFDKLLQAECDGIESMPLRE